MTTIHFTKPLLGILLTAAGVFCALTAQAKLPPPSDEAKTRAEETKAKTAWSNKVADYQLCKAQDRVAARYRKAGKEAKPAVETPACVDPGSYVPPAIVAVGTATPNAASGGAVPATAPAAPGTNPGAAKKP